jgi:osmotically-inducible protein OsmY
MTPTLSTNPAPSATTGGRSRPHDGSILDGASCRLRRSGYHQLRRITFDFHEGVLTLRGIVSSFFLKQLAHALVANVEGVDEVANRLEVRYPAASYGT